MSRYKMRAECQVDLGRFLNKVPVTSLAAERSETTPDIVIEFASSLSLDEIRNNLAIIVDGHVMLETVALYKDYTGERG